MGELDSSILEAYLTEEAERRTVKPGGEETLHTERALSRFAVSIDYSASGGWPDEAILRGYSAPQPDYRRIHDIPLSETQPQEIG